ncbi:MAG: DUF4199 domain-containing protein [Paludibacteraceae bacterium]
MKPMILKHAMYFGLLFGLLFCLNFYLSTIEAAISNALSWVLVLLMPYVAYRLTVDCRERVCDGVISYGMALWYGIQLFFYAALVASVFKLVYFNYINPDFLPNQIDQTLKLMEQMQMPFGATEVSELKKVVTPVNMSLNYIWLDVMAGVFVSLFTAALAKREAPMSN